MKESNLFLISASLKLHPPAAVKRDVMGLGGKGLVARCQSQFQQTQGSLSAKLVPLLCNVFNKG